MWPDCKLTIQVQDWFAEKTTWLRKRRVNSKADRRVRLFDGGSCKNGRRESYALEVIAVRHK